VGKFYQKRAPTGAASDGQKVGNPLEPTQGHPPEPGAEVRWRKNRAHWDRTLDSRNLTDSAAPLAVERQIDLFQTADVRRGLAFLAPLEGRFVMDLGGGPGLLTTLLAREGATVVLADISLPRLHKARLLTAEAGCADRALFVVCSGDALPFRDGAFDRQITKAVLIHTPLAATAGELARTLRPSGRACFIEPLTGNPFVELYRRLAAPGIWREITDYFTEKESATLEAAWHRAGRHTHREDFYFLGFFASAFGFILSNPALLRAAEAALLVLDRGCFLISRRARQSCWFRIHFIAPKSVGSTRG